MGTHRVSPNWLRIAALMLFGAPLLLPAPLSRQAQTKLVNDVLKRVSGTWTLQRRINPNGTDHAKPLKGEIIFRMEMDSAGAALGKGTSAAFEAGVLSSVFSGDFGGGPLINPDPTASNVMFEIKANSGLEVTVNAETSVVTMAFTDHEIQGNYGVFRNGIRTQRLEINFLVQKTGFGESQLSLVSQPLKNIPSDIRGVGSLADKSHQYGALNIRGEKMAIQWGNGGRDVWVRTAR